MELASADYQKIDDRYPESSAKWTSRCPICEKENEFIFSYKQPAALWINTPENQGRMMINRNLRVTMAYTKDVCVHAVGFDTHVMPYPMPPAFLAIFSREEPQSEEVQP